MPRKASKPSFQIAVSSGYAGEGIESETVKPSFKTIIKQAYLSVKLLFSNEF